MKGPLARTVKIIDDDGGDQASELPARHVVQRGAKICFLSELIYAGYLYLKLKTI